MTDKPGEDSGKDRPEDDLGKDFADLTPEEFLDKTADNKKSELKRVTPAGQGEGKGSADPIADLKALVAERTEDLQRLQAEYVNYKKRVDRDRDLARNQGVESVVRDLMPVFDAITQASAHGELTGGFKLVADELGRLAGKNGLVLYGEPGEEFDPRRHEALMQVPVSGDGEMLVHEVMQKGVELHGLVVRPARVVVAVPSGEPTEQGGQGADATGPDEPEPERHGDEPGDAQDKGGPGESPQDTDGESA